MPSVRLLPGQPTPSCIPSDFGQSTLVIVSDEGPDMKLSTNFLTSVGMRLRWEKDFSHRYDNTHKMAVADAQYDEDLAKLVFLSRVNRGPWGSAKNMQMKSELFTQMAQVAKASGTMLKQAESDVLFDRSSTAFLSDNVSDEMLGDVPTIINQTEGMEGKRFFPLSKSGTILIKDGLWNFCLWMSTSRGKERSIPMWLQVTWRMHRVSTLLPNLHR